ncbi:MAG: hypothetical protein MI749_20050 [Desulfovibrionales bacterium]|nr:hypothetical protein [Desulfovibrionales bacterium]
MMRHALVQKIFLTVLIGVTGYIPVVTPVCAAPWSTYFSDTPLHAPTPYGATDTPLPTAYYDPNAPLYTSDYQHVLTFSVPVDRPRQAVRTLSLAIKRQRAGIQTLILFLDGGVTLPILQTLPEEGKPVSYLDIVRTQDTRRQGRVRRDGRPIQRVPFDSHAPNRQPADIHTGTVYRNAPDGPMPSGYQVQPQQLLSPDKTRQNDPALCKGAPQRYTQPLFIDAPTLEAFALYMPILHRQLLEHARLGGTIVRCLCCGQTPSKRMTYLPVHVSPNKLQRLKKTLRMKEGQY